MILKKPEELLKMSCPLWTRHRFCRFSNRPEPPLPQLQIIADRDKIAQYGLNVSDVAILLKSHWVERLYPKYSSAIKYMIFHVAIPRTAAILRIKSVI